MLLLTICQQVKNLVKCKCLQWFNLVNFLFLDNVGEKVLTNIAINLARDNLLGLVNNLGSNALSEFARRVSGVGAVWSGRRFTLFTSNGCMNDIIKIKKSLEDLRALIDWVTQTIKHEIRKTKTWISWSFVVTFSSFNNATSEIFSSKI